MSDPLKIPANAREQIISAMAPGSYARTVGTHLLPTFVLEQMADRALRLVESWQDAPAVFREPDVSGFAIISDMSPQQMIEEVIAYQSEVLGRVEFDQLKLMLIQIRASKYQKRMIDEARIEGGPHWYGGGTIFGGG